MAEQPEPFTWEHAHFPIQVTAKLTKKQRQQWEAYQRRWEQKIRQDMEKELFGQ